MSFEGNFQFVQRLIVDFNLSFIKTHSNYTSRSIKSYCIGSVWSGVECFFFFDHSDVPNFGNSVWVASCYFVSLEVESTIIYWIVVSIEGLDTETCFHVPERNCFVGTGSCYYIGIRLEMDSINRVNVASEGMSTFSNIHIENLSQMVHGSTSEEISSIMDIDIPDRLNVIFEGMGTWSIDKIPNFDSGISTCSQDVKSLGMESDWG